MRNIGSSVGISIVMTLLSRNTQINHAEIASRLTPFGDNAAQIAAMIGTNAATGLAALNGEVTRQASAIAFLNDFWLMMVHDRGRDSAAADAEAGARARRARGRRRSLIARHRIACARRVACAHAEAEPTSDPPRARIAVVACSVRACPRCPNATSSAQAERETSPHRAHRQRARCRDTLSNAIRAAVAAASAEQRRAAREMRLYGLNACLAAFAKRPEALRKVYLTEARIPR